MSEQRTRYVVVLENVNTNLHLHLLVAIADKAQLSKFCAEANPAWKAVAPAGNADVRPATTPVGAAGYMMKQITLDTFYRVRFSGDH